MFYSNKELLNGLKELYSENDNNKKLSSSEEGNKIASYLNIETLVHSKLQPTINSGNLLNRVLNNQSEQDDDIDKKDSIIEYLTKLKLLKNIPLNYLIPREELLPIDSIRFFYLDENWINALIDGAYSIGTNTKVKTNTSNQLRNSDTSSKLEANIHVATMAKLHESIKVSQKVYRMHSFSNYPTNLQNVVNPSNQNDVRTGFILRSLAVSKWPTLEVFGFQKEMTVNDTPSSKNLLNIVRMERITPDILLCIFEGEVKSVLFSAPCESLHFGFEEQQEGKRKIRKVLRGNDGQPKDELAVEAIPMRNNDDNTRVIKISQLVQDVKTNINWIDDLPSSQFAMQMVLGTDSIIFNID